MKKFASAKPGTLAGSLVWLCKAVPAAGLLAGLLLVTACDKVDGPTYPNAPAPASRNWLYDVIGTSAQDIWACGNKGTMFHFDGAAWTPVNMGSADPIVSMIRAQDGSLYACGHKGRIWHNSGGTWSAMDSGTTSNLYGLGSYLGTMHACGEGGVLRRLSGSTWSDPNLNQMVLRDQSGAPQDTLLLNKDVAALLTVNTYAIGGAYLDPLYTGEEIGMLGTKGMILAEDNDFDWILRPLGGDRLIAEEWILCNYSDPQTLANNYLGSSEGWLFRLNTDGSWVLQPPKLSLDPGGGVRDIWLDAAFNLYLVTDEGQIYFQSADYDFETDTGSRVLLEDFTYDFAGIWGTSPQDLYVVGFMEDLILHCSHDQATGAFTAEEIPVVFPDKSFSLGPAVDQFGRPRP
jgi:hypothetical protein